MQRYLIKKIFTEDEEGKKVITDYELRMKVSSKALPYAARGGAFEIIKGEDFEHAKIELDENGSPQIVEDTEKKNEVSTKKLDKADKVDKLKKAYSKIDNISELSEVKIILKRLVKIVLLDNE